MTLTTLPNIEAIVCDWLRGHPDIATLGPNVAGRTPATTTQPWIRVTLIDASDSPLSSLEYLVQYTLQCDCFAGKTSTDDHRGQAEAYVLKSMARAVLKAMQGETLGGATITNVSFVGDTRVPDETMAPARERYILSVAVWAHGVPA